MNWIAVFIFILSAIAFGNSQGAGMQAVWVIVNVGSQVAIFYSVWGKHRSR